MRNKHMATVLERNGSYRIKVSCGYDIHGNKKLQYKTWRPPENMTERQIKKELERHCVLFEEECKKGQITAAIKFEALAEEWFENYAKLNLKKTYREIRDNYNDITIILSCRQWT